MVCKKFPCFPGSQSCDEANGWTEMNGKCFRVSGNAAETQYTWYEARESCAAEGGDLATFTSLEEQMFVVNKVQPEQI